MSTYLHNTIPNLKPFVFEKHYDSLLINKQWILVNGISKKKSVYTFKTDNILEIERKDTTIKTSWTINIENIFSIETEDGLKIVKAFFKDNDILVLSHQDNNEFALYINTTEYKDDLNTVEDIQDYLKSKYKKKFSKTIKNHQFYYIQKSEEFGPNTLEELSMKVKNDDISAYCFVRDVNEDDYSNRLRIVDLMQEV